MFSKVKRFTDKSEPTPGPGAYNPKLKEHVPGALITAIGTPSKKGQGQVDDSVCSTASTGSYCSVKLAKPIKKLYGKPKASVSSNESHEETVAKGCAVCKRMMQFGDPLETEWPPSLKKCRDALEEQKKRLQDKLKELDNISWEKDDTIRFLKGEIAAVTDQMLQGEQANFEAGAEIATYKEKLEHLEEEETTLNQNIRLLSEKYQQIESQLAEEHTHHDCQVTELEARLDLTKVSLEEIRQECAALQDKNKQLLDALNIQKEELEKLKEQLQMEEQNKSNLESSMRQKDDKLTDLEIHIEATNIELQNTKDIVQKQETILQSLNEKIQSLNDQEKSLFTQLNTQEEANLQMTRCHADRILQLEQSDILLTDQKNSKEEQLEIANQKCSQLQEDVCKLRIEVDSVRQEFEQTIVQLKTLQQEKVNDLTEQLKASEKNKEIVQKQIQDTESQNNDLQEQITSIAESNLVLEMKLKESEQYFKDQIHSNLEVIEKLSDNVEKLCLEKGDICRKVEQANLDKEVSAQALDTAEVKVNELRGKLVETESQWQTDYQRLSDELVTIEEEKEILKQNISLMETENNSLAEQLHSAESQLEEKKTVSQNSHQLQEKITRLQEENKLASDSHESEKLMITDNLNKALSHITQIEKQKETIETEIKSKEQEIVQLEEQVQQALQDVNKEKMASIDIVEKLSSTLEFVRNEKETFENKYHKSQSVCEALGLEKCEIRTQLEQADTKAKTLSDEMEMAKNKNTILCEKMTDLEFNMEKQEGMHNDEKNVLLEEKQKLQLKLDQAMQEQTMMITDLHELQENVERQDQGAAQTAEMLKSKLDVAVMGNRHMEDKIIKIEANYKSVQRENGNLMQEIDYLKSTNQHLELKVTQHEDKGIEEMESLKQQMQQLLDDKKHWQEKYEELAAKMEPFIDQLDAYELEKQALLGRSKNAQAEVDKLSQEYGRILGHQNHKQKIHHLVKIKEENNALKKEVTALKEINNKTKRSLTKAEDKVKDLEGKKRFDPTKAFTGKENDASTGTTPLKQGNRV